MMAKKGIFGLLTASCLFAATGANALSFGKPIETEVLVTGSAKGVNASGTPAKKKVILMNVLLSEQERHSLFAGNPQKLAAVTTRTALPASVDLGMNKVPVLDQGRHGTCVTFATTAAIDAALGAGDYISQLCQLELASYLEKSMYGYMSSGWDGSWAPWVLDQMMRFGIVNKTTQRQESCGGVTDYPVYSANSRGNPVTLDEFSQYSEPLFGRVYYAQLLSLEQRLMTPFGGEDLADKALIRVRTALSKGDRVLFSAFLVLQPYCSAGACAMHHKPQDTWALTRELSTPPYFTGGHEMVITGYDDAATAVDSEGKHHTGLLILRNSWGEEVGDQGNFYMTYDYFRKFAIDAHEVGAVSGSF